MQQAIITKYLAPTNTRGGRVRAKAYAGALTLAWDHSRSVAENHTQAARALCLELDWDGTWYQGTAPDNQGYAFVCVEGAAAFTIKGGK
jgi:hypothetical protein